MNNSQGTNLKSFQIHGSPGEGDIIHHQYINQLGPIPLLPTSHDSLSSEHPRNLLNDQVPPQNSGKLPPLPPPQNSGKLPPLPPPSTTPPAHARFLDSFNNNRSGEQSRPPTAETVSSKSIPTKPNSGINIQNSTGSEVNPNSSLETSRQSNGNVEISGLPTTELDHGNSQKEAASYSENQDPSNIASTFATDQHLKNLRALKPPSAFLSSRPHQSSKVDILSNPSTSLSETQIFNEPPSNSQASMNENEVLDSEDEIPLARINGAIPPVRVDDEIPLARMVSRKSSEKPYGQVSLDKDEVEEVFSPFKPCSTRVLNHLTVPSTVVSGLGRILNESDGQITNKLGNGPNKTVLSKFSYPAQMLETSERQFLNQSSLVTEQDGTSYTNNHETRSNTLDTSHSKNRETSHTNTLDTSHTNTLDTSHPNTLDTSHTNSLDISHTNSLDTSHTNNLDTSQPNSHNKLHMLQKQRAQKILANKELILQLQQRRKHEVDQYKMVIRRLEDSVPTYSSTQDRSHYPNSFRQVIEAQDRAKTQRITKPDLNKLLENHDAENSQLLAKHSAELDHMNEIIQAERDRIDKEARHNYENTSTNSSRTESSPSDTARSKPAYPVNDIESDDGDSDGESGGDSDGESGGDSDGESGGETSLALQIDWDADTSSGSIFHNRNVYSNGHGSRYHETPTKAQATDKYNPVPNSNGKESLILPAQPEPIIPPLASKEPIIPPLPSKEPIMPPLPSDLPKPTYSRSIFDIAGESAPAQKKQRIKGILGIELSEDAFKGVEDQSISPLSGRIDTMKLGTPIKPINLPQVETPETIGRDNI